MIPSPQNINPDVLKHFSDVPNTANISPEVDSFVSTLPNRNEINEICRRIWASKLEQLKAYDYGQHIGTINNIHNITLTDILGNLNNAIRQIISNEMIKNGGTTEEYKPIYDAIDNLINILQISFSKSDKSKNIEIVSILAGIHGFICSYVNSIKNIK